MPSTASTARSRSANCGRYCPAPRSRPYELTFWPSSVTSTTPSRASSSTSWTMSPIRRLTSRPRTDGTMQNAHELSQPIWIVTQAAWSTSRRAGSADGYSSCSSRISTSGPSSRARASSSGACARLCVPNTTSTCGARASTSSRSFWARHPPTAIWRSGRRLLQLLQPAEVAVELVVGVLPDAARVEHHDVGGVEIVGRLHALGRRAGPRSAPSRARSSGTRRCARRSGRSRRPVYEERVRAARSRPRREPGRRIRREVGHAIPAGPTSFVRDDSCAI